MGTLNFITKATKTHGLSRREIAHLVGTHEQTVYKWETGERNPSAAVVTLFEALDVLMASPKGRAFVRDRIERNVQGLAA